tara:strand:+ start:183602 stop:184333 length:732 start_codon:yes stop_codon:yes gene_type:complete
MKRHLVMYNARTGSTVVGNHIAENLCTPPFNFYEHGLESTEIHDDEYDWYLGLMIDINKKYPEIEWCMKWNIMCGLRDGMKQKSRYALYEFDFAKVHNFFKITGVTDLHFSFRHDMIDTICSFIIAEQSGNWVVRKRKKAIYEPFEVDKGLIEHYIKTFDLSHQAYSRVVEEMKDKYTCHFYPYETLGDIIDIDNDPHGLTKQLSKDDKTKIITNYDDIEKAIKESRIWNREYDESTGVYTLE